MDLGRGPRHFGALRDQLISGVSRTFDADRYGNLVASADSTSAVTTYAYDEAARLTTISPAGGAGTQVSFSLDALDRHASRAVGGTTSDTYAYLDATETTWQTGQGTTTAALLDAAGTRLALKTGSTVSWLVVDLHGSVVALCPAGSSTISDAYRFDGFDQPGRGHRDRRQPVPLPGRSEERRVGKECRL